MTILNPRSGYSPVLGYNWTPSTGTLSDGTATTLASGLTGKRIAVGYILLTNNNASASQETKLYSEDRSADPEIWCFCFYSRPVEYVLFDSLWRLPEGDDLVIQRVATSGSLWYTVLWYYAPLF